MKIYFSILILFISLAFISCPSDDGSNNNGNPGIIVKTGKVTFFNESSYRVVVHQDAFSGPVLVELSSGQSKAIDVRTSENYGSGTMFSIEYLYRVTDGFDIESGDVTASGLDPSVQINRVIEENKTYTIQIPQPANLEFRSAFIKILNTHSLPCEFRYMSTVFKQTGNENIPVAPGKTGVYKFENIPSGGSVFQNYQVAANFVNTTIPDFSVQNGFIYSFTYNGSSVTKTGEQTILFN
jgi:hypothetical protein